MNSAHGRIAMTSSRLQYIELRKNSALQVGIFFAIFACVSLVFFRSVGIPLAEKLFAESFHANLEMEGEGLNMYTNWRMTVAPPVGKHGEVIGDQSDAKIYYYNPLLAILPVVIAIGLFGAGLATSVMSPRLGYLRQKIEREIINTLHRYARIEHAEHSDSDLQELSETIKKADIHRLHDLEDHWHVSFQELEIMQSAIRWRERSMLMRLVRVDDALRHYLREHFTIRYENPVLGMIYIGAAILIIIIGLRGLQFIPKDRPSLVLFAISLEFILLIVYAISLIYTKESEPVETENASLDVQSIFGPGSSNASTQQAEKLLRMFVSTPVVSEARDKEKSSRNT